MDQSSVFRLADGQLVFVKLAANYKLAITRPTPMPGQGLMDLLHFHLTVPYEDHQLIQIEFDHHRLSSIRIQDAADWRHSNKGYTELGYADQRITLIPKHMNDEQLAYFALQHPPAST